MSISHLHIHTLADVKNGTLRAGQRIEVFDEHPAKRVFMEASVLSVTATHVRVHFIVRPPGGTHRTASAFRRLPCSCRTPCMWCVVVVDLCPQGWTSRWDEDLPLTSSRIAPIGTQTRERRYYRYVLRVCCQPTHTLPQH